MVRQTRLRTAADLSNSTSFAPPPPQQSSPSSYLNNFAVGDRIPGFRTSAAFLTSLRANLHLTETTDAHLGLSPSSDMSSSAASTPPTLLPTNPSSSSAPQLAATTTTTTTTDPPTQPPLPTLTTAPTTDPKTLLAALRLIADSVAQQRQSASRALIFHPLVLAAFTAVLALVAQFLYRSAGDLALVATTWAGLVMAALVAVRWAASGYIVLAERIGWRWLEDGQADADGADVVLVSRWGEEVIGALVLRFVRDEAVSAVGPAAAGAGGGAGSGKAARRSKAGKAGGTSTACIRAWTVKLRFRGKGVGTGLLEEAVRVCRERGVEAVDFAPVHANSGRVLPALFNGVFERREARARKALEEVVRGQGGVGGRKR